MLLAARGAPSMWEIAVHGLTPAQRQVIADAMQQVAFASRTLLYREGEPCSLVSVLESGRVRSFNGTEHGREFTNLVSGPGAVLGFVSIVLEVPAIISVESLDPIIVSQIRGPDLVALMHAMPQLCFNFNRMLATIYVDGIARGRRSIESAPVRLGRVLFNLASLEAGADGAGGEIRGLTQQDIAAMVNTTRSWVAQMLGAFDEAGLIEHRRGVIRIPDLARLQQHISQLEAHGAG